MMGGKVVIGECYVKVCYEEMQVLRGGNSG